MANIWFTSDLHDGHRNIGTYRSSLAPEVTCVDSNREFIRSKWRAKKKDKVIILGDCCFAKDSHLFMQTLLGNKELVLGNHDLENTSRNSLSELQEAFTKICGVRKWGSKNKNTKTGESLGKFWLQHTPIHPNELRGIRQLHGHIHDKDKDFMNIGSSNYDSRYINVNMDVLLPRTGEIMIDLKELEDYVGGF